MTGFVHEVRGELARLQPSRRCCRLAELSALLHVDGTYAIRGSHGHCLVTESSSPGTARKIFSLAHSLFAVETGLVKVSRNTPRRGNVYRLEIPEQPGFHQVMNELGVLDASLSPEPVVPRRLTRYECCAGAALRGAFLGGGYVSEPYGRASLEIYLSDGGACGAFAELMRRRSIDPGVRRRRGHWVLYLKRRQEISDFLAVVGAHHAHLEWESQTILNSTKNAVNRLVNCDSANARRLSDASLRQREAIDVINARGALSGADPRLAELAELAELRVARPDASLAELGRMLEPPVSKAVVQSRMRRLERMAEELAADR